MKLFRIRGGVHVEHRKELSSEQAIVTLPLPAWLYIPLQQHIGAPAEPVVVEGDVVLKGQLLAKAGSAVSAPLHAPTSGRIAQIGDWMAPHPSGLTQRTIILESDGRDQWCEPLLPIDDPFAADAKTIAARAAECGLVGMGGAAFPTAVKLDLGTRIKLDTLVINGAECEPYLTCDDRLMRERTDEVLDGVRIMAHALGVERIVVAIETNKPQALAIMTQAVAAGGWSKITVTGIPARYPMGSERHLVHVLTGRETPARKLTADIGVVVHNVATARAVHHAVRHGRPLVARVMTVSGQAVRRPQNIEVPLGTLVAELIDHCGGLTEPPARLLSGGPMMGQPLPGRKVPVIKGTSGILALSAVELHGGPVQPCIKCGTCVSVCPCGLVPLEMASYIRKDRLDAAAKIGVQDCVGCGSCAYACPAHIPLVHYFNYAKGRLSAQEREQRKRDRIKRLAVARADRMEKIAKAKREAMAARKAAAKKPEAVAGSAQA
ncbi:MAG: electron transport complex subunit RsxC [Azospirillum sp.]|nr:electron transport complex subunit RsxC [Azospirillum sp.]